MQKQKLLYLRKIMLEKTDENHGLTSSEILAELASYGIQAERKSLYDDLQVLKTTYRSPLYLLAIEGNRGFSFLPTNNINGDS